MSQGRNRVATVEIPATRAQVGARGPDPFALQRAVERALSSLHALGEEELSTSTPGASLGPPHGSGMLPQPSGTRRAKAIEELSAARGVGWEFPCEPERVVGLLLSGAQVTAEHHTTVHVPVRAVRGEEDDALLEERQTIDGWRRFTSFEDLERWLAGGKRPMSLLGVTLTAP